VYSCFARWQRLGLWKALLLNLLRSWRVACGDNPAPSVVVANSRSCRSAPTCGKHGIEQLFAWLSRYRRLNTIFNRTDESLIAFVYIVFISILACRLSRLRTEGSRA
jgi:transposase